MRAWVQLVIMHSLSWDPLFFRLRGAPSKANTKVCAVMLEVNLVG